MKVKFVPQNIELEIKPNQSVKNLADENDVFIKSICNGLPSCAECRVKIVEGEHNVLPPATKELNLIGNGYFIDQRRLSWQFLCFGDITVDLSEQVEKQKSHGSKRPQGSRKAETEVSHAVTGNLIEQQNQELKEIASHVPEQGDRQPQRQRQGGQRQQQQGGRQDNQRGGGRNNQGGGRS